MRESTQDALQRMTAQAETYRKQGEADWAALCGPLNWACRLSLNAPEPTRAVVAVLELLGSERARADKAETERDAPRAERDEVRLSAAGEYGMRVAARQERDHFRSIVEAYRAGKIENPQVATLRAELERVRGALRLQDPRNATERYEAIARDFNRETGFFAPGKSMPAAMGGLSEEDENRRQALWRPFVNRWHEQWFDAALAEVE